jgi:hypothetical protein
MQNPSTVTSVETLPPGMRDASSSIQSAPADSSRMAQARPANPAPTMMIIAEG